MAEIIFHTLLTLVGLGAVIWVACDAGIGSSMLGVGVTLLVAAFLNGAKKK